jgi:hypothetical protein
MTDNYSYDLNLFVQTNKPSVHPIENSYFKSIYYRPFYFIDGSKPNNIIQGPGIGITCESESLPDDFKNTKIKLGLQKIPNEINYGKKMDKVLKNPDIKYFTHKFIFREITLHNKNGTNHKYILIYKNFKPDINLDRSDVQYGFDLNHLFNQDYLSKTKKQFGGAETQYNPPSVQSTKQDTEKPNITNVRDNDFILWAVSFKDDTEDYIEVYDFVKECLDDVFYTYKYAGPTKNKHLFRLTNYTQDEIYVTNEKGPWGHPIFPKLNGTQTVIHWAIGTYMKILKTLFGVKLNYMKTVKPPEVGSKIVIEEPEEGEKPTQIYNFILTTDTNEGENIRGVILGDDGPSNLTTPINTGFLGTINAGPSFVNKVIGTSARYSRNSLLSQYSGTKKESREQNTEWLEKLRNPDIDEDDEEDDEDEQITTMFGGAKKRRTKRKTKKKTRKKKKTNKRRK